MLNEEKMYMSIGVNEITWATPTCFLIAFVTVLWEIFLEYF
jgi:hypothetical protein